MSSWDAVVKSPSFGNLSSDQKELVRNQYFIEEIAPKIPEEHLEAVRKIYDEDTLPTIRKPASFASDTANLFGAGVQQFGIAGRELLSRAMPDSWVKAIDDVDAWLHGGVGGKDLMEKNLKGNMEDLSPEMSTAMKKEWWDDDKGELGAAASDPRAYWGSIMMSLPETAATMVPAAKVGKAVFGAQVAKGASTKVAAAKAATAAQITGSVMEGALGGAHSADDVRDTILAMPNETLMKSEAVKSLMSSGMTFEDAKKRLAEDASTQAFVTAGVATGIFGGLGDRMLAKGITSGIKGGIVKRIGKGAVSEGLLEEFPQSYLSKVAENVALQQADPTISTTSGAMNEAIGGLAAGSVMGAGFGAVTREQSPLQQASDEILNNTPPESDLAKQAADALKQDALTQDELMAAASGMFEEAVAPVAGIDASLATPPNPVLDPQLQAALDRLPDTQEDVLNIARTQADNRAYRNRAFDLEQQKQRDYDAALEAVRNKEVELQTAISRINEQPQQPTAMQIAMQAALAKRSKETPVTGRIESVTASPQTVPMEPAEGLLNGQDGPARQASPVDAQTAGPLFTPATIAEDINAAPITRQILDVTPTGETVQAGNVAIQDRSKAAITGPEEVYNAPQKPLEKFPIRPHGKGVAIDVKTKEELETVRAQLSQAGVKAKGLYNTKTGTLQFGKDQAAAVRGALGASISGVTQSTQPWEMSLDSMIAHQRQRNIAKIAQLELEENELIDSAPNVGRGNLTRKSKRDSSGLNARAKWDEVNGRKLLSIKEQIASIRSVNDALGTAEGRKKAAAFHRKKVENALSENKPVPAEVLAEYPDLQEKTQPPIQGRIAVSDGDQPAPINYPSTKQATAPKEETAQKEGGDQQPINKPDEAILSDQAGKHPTKDKFKSYLRGRLGAEKLKELDDSGAVDRAWAEAHSDESPAPEAFVKAPDGGVNFGEISTDIAKIIKRQPGPIRLQHGEHPALHKGYGEVHIQAEHPEIGDVHQFVAEVANGYDSIYKSRLGRLVLVKGENEKQKLVVELRPGEDNDFYSVITAYKTQRNMPADELLWDAAHSRSADLGGRPALSETATLAKSDESRSRAGQTAAQTSIGQSGDNRNSAIPDAITKMADAVAKLADKVDAIATENASKKQEKIDTTPERVEETPEPRQERIEDFGEVLHGARKHQSAYSDRLADAKSVDVATEPLSKSWPEPDYQKLIEEGGDPWAVAFIRAVRDEIPTKPQKSWKLAGWANNVKDLRDMANDVLSGVVSRDRAEALLNEDQRSRLRGTVGGRVDLYLAAGHNLSLKGVTLAKRDYVLYKGLKDVTLWVVEQEAKATAFSNMPRHIATGDTKEEAIEGFKSAISMGALDKPTAIKFDIYSYRGGEKAGKFYVGKKVGKSYIDLKSFGSSAEARQYLASNQSELERLLKQAKEIPSERRETNEPRVGVDHRSGADVTPVQFADAFGFRGVQFGNYVEGDRRQQDLNDAYDALMDMAGVLGLPPKALSLNGELGLAFGARGKGAAGRQGGHVPSAHYEAGTVVINLTKSRGAGSLAHEWWHAVDNYFSRARNQKEDFLTERPYERGEGVRPQMIAAFKGLVQTINSTGLKQRSAALDKRRTKEYWGTGREMSARSFESYITAKLKDQGAANDYLANIVSQEYWDAAQALGLEKDGNTYPYLEAAEIPAVRAAFDHFFNTVETKETEKGVALFSFAGERAATADKMALSTAQERIAKGDDPETVRQETGWHKGVDGKWRYEISDAGAYLNGSKKASFDWTFDKLTKEKEAYDSEFDPVFLSDVIRHPKLFAAYPALANIKVELLPNGSSEKGRIDKNNRTIQINRDIDGDEALSVILHEVQHGIQTIEGFASGGNSDQFRKSPMLLPDPEVLEQAETLLGWSNQYGKSVDEFTSGKPPKYLGSEWHTAAIGLAKRPSDLARLRAEYEVSRDPEASYRHLAGEVEARNTQARAGMTDDQRRTTPPSSTADVAAEDVIVMFNGKVMENAPAPNNADSATIPKPQPSKSQAMAKRLNNNLALKYGKEWKEAFYESALPDDLAGIRDAVRAAFGKEVVYITATDDQFDFFDGVYLGGNAVYVNSSSSVSLVNIIGHELYHDIEKTRPDLIEWFRRKANQYIKNLPEYQARLNRTVPEEGDKYTEAMAKRELLADFMGDAFADPEFLQELADDNPSKFKTLLTRVTLFLQRISNRLRGLGSHEYFDQVNELREHLRDVLKAYSAGKSIADVTWDSFAASRKRDSVGGMSESKGAGDNLTESKPQTPESEEFDIFGAPITAEDKAEAIRQKDARARDDRVIKEALDARDKRFILNESGLRVIIGALDAYKDGEVTIRGVVHAIEQVLNLDDNIHIDAGSYGNVQVRSVASTILVETYTGRYVDIGSKVWEERGYIDVVINGLIESPQLFVRNIAEAQAQAIEDTVSDSKAFGDYLDEIKNLNLASTPEGRRASLRIIKGGKDINPNSSQRPPSAGDDTLSYSITIDGIERPTTNSKGQPIAHTEEAIRNFWRWFGDSKVVDEEGRPLVVYHGTKENFDSFSINVLGSTTGAQSAKKGFFFAAKPDTTNAYSIAPNLTSLSPSNLRKVENKAAKMRYADAMLDDAYAELVAYGEGDYARSSIDERLAMEEGYRERGRTGSLSAAEEYKKAELRVLDSRIEEGALTMPVYLAISNPALHDQKGEKYRDRAYSEIIGSAINSGSDGAIIKNTYDGGDLDDIYVVFSPEQIKSAIGNRGAFSPDDTRISYSLKKQPPSPPKEPQPSAGVSAFTAPEASKLDDFLYKVQDKHIDTKRIVQAIEQQIGKINDHWNVYMHEALYHGRAAKYTQDFLTDELEPLTMEMAKAGVTQDELNEYLHARHAEERNRVMKERNPDRENNDDLSGMADDKAREILKNASPKMKALANRVDAIIARTRQMMVEYGLEKQSTVDGWGEQYEHYVPLKREGFDDVVGGAGTGSGFSVRGSSTKEAVGSHRAVDNIFANIAMQRERIITRGEKNRVAVSLLGLAKLNPNKDFWKIDKPTQITQINPETGLEETVPGDIGEYAVPKIRYIGPDGTVTERADPTYKGRHNVVVARINGEDRAVIFNEHDPRALRMAEALKNLDADQLGQIVGSIGKVTRYFASINTQYNPVFGVINLMRDVQTAALNLQSTHIKDRKLAVMKAVPGTLKGIYQDARAIRKRKPPTSKYAELWEEFEKVGGPTGYRDMFRTAKDRAEAINHMLDPEWWQKTKPGKVATLGGILAKPEQLIFTKVGQPLFRWLSDYNLAMENSVRLAAYKVGKEQGMSKEQAAFMAKNLTVNFNKKGQVATQAGALYAFFNASVQGSARIAETLTHDAKPGEIIGKTGKAIIYGGITLGAMQALALMLAGFDEDEPPEFVRERNLILPAPGTDKGYVSIPMPLGFHVFPNIGRVITETILYGKPIDRGIDLLLTTLEAFNPIGGGASFAQTLSPTVADPIVALSENKDWTGKSIYREDFNKLNPTPGFERAKDNATILSRGIAYGINAATGGTDYTPGRWSPSPDSIDYLLGQAGGGVAREASKFMVTGETLASGEGLPPTYKIPLVGRLVGTASDKAAVRDRFYDNLRDMNMHQAEIEGQAKDGIKPTQYIDAHPEAKLYRAAGKAESVISELQQRRKTLVKLGRHDDALKVGEQIDEIMRNFNEKVKAAQK